MTEEEYRTALAELKSLRGAPPGTPESDRLEELMDLVEAYEELHYPIEPPDPRDAVRFRMEQMDITVDDLEARLGLKGAVREFLGGKGEVDPTVLETVRKHLGIADQQMVRAPTLKTEETLPHSPTM